MPVIYKLISPSGKAYIGKSKYDYNYRWNLHMIDYKKFLKAQENEDSDYKGCYALYGAFKKYSPEEFKHQILYEFDNIDPIELKNIEIKMILEHKTYVESKGGNGYNLIVSGDGGFTSDETRAKMSKAQKARAESHSLEHRKHKKELEGLPMYVLYYKKGDIRGYRIAEHPKCKHARFVSKNRPLEEHKQEVIEFLNKLENENTIHECSKVIKQKNGLPSGISKSKTGSKGYIMAFTEKGIKYYRKFIGENEETLQKAIEFMQIFRNHLKTDHECSSETKCQSALCSEVYSHKRTS